MPLPCRQPRTASGRVECLWRLRQTNGVLAALLRHRRDHVSEVRSGSALIEAETRSGADWSSGWIRSGRTPCRGPAAARTGLTALPGPSAGPICCPQSGAVRRHNLQPKPIGVGCSAQRHRRHYRQFNRLTGSAAALIVAGMRPKSSTWELIVYLSRDGLQSPQGSRGPLRREMQESQLLSDHPWRP